MRGLRVSLAVVGLGAVLGSAAVVMLRSLDAPGPRAVQVGDGFDPIEASRRWDRQPAIELAGLGPDEFRSLVAEVVSECAGDAELSAEQSEELERRLASELRIRSTPDADAAVRRVDADPGSEWISCEDAREWHIINTWHEAQFGAPADCEDAAGALRRSAARILTDHGGRFVGVATDEHDGTPAALVRVLRVRSLEELMLRERDELSRESRDRWLRGPANEAIRFHRPVRSFGDVRRDQGRVTVALVRMIVRLEGGHSANWGSTWYWDERSRRWDCLTMERRGVHVRALFF